ncbi:MAG: hypothetical protein KDD94_04880 [Calditrichaeota bacterium]|nr:hypothetical protein [Calditrichota bacterium]
MDSSIYCKNRRLHISILFIIIGLLSCAQRNAQVTIILDNELSADSLFYRTTDELNYQKIQSAEFSIEPSRFPANLDIQLWRDGRSYALTSSIDSVKSQQLALKLSFRNGILTLSKQVNLPEIYYLVGQDKTYKYIDGSLVESYPFAIKHLVNDRLAIFMSYSGDRLIGRDLIDEHNVFEISLPQNYRSKPGYLTYSQFTDRIIFDLSAKGNVFKEHLVVMDRYGNFSTIASDRYYYFAPSCDERGEKLYFLKSTQLLYAGDLYFRNVNYPLAEDELVLSDDSLTFAVPFISKNGKKLVAVYLNVKSKEVGIIYYDLESKIRQYFQFPNLLGSGTGIINPVINDELGLIYFSVRPFPKNKAGVYRFSISDKSLTRLTSDEMMLIF